MNDPSTKTTASGREAINDTISSVPTNEKLPDGQFKDHWVLTEEERRKGFVRPIRREYVHEKCKTNTIMPLIIAETYAAKPGFYGKTFCCHCGDYFKVGITGEFLWKGTNSKVGS
jgi:hypothetical protein